MACCSGNRLVTALGYLRDLPPGGGGATRFTKLQMQVCPREYVCTHMYMADPQVVYTCRHRVQGIHAHAHAHAHAHTS